MTQHNRHERDSDVPEIPSFLDRRPKRPADTQTVQFAAIETEPGAATGNESPSPHFSDARLPDNAPAAHPTFGAPAAFYVYTSPGGTPLSVLYRFETGDGRKIFLPYNLEMQKWKGLDKPRPLFGLERFSKFSGPIILAEGEKAANALLETGFAATTCLNGANGIPHTDLSPLRGREVVVWPDNDAPGRKFASNAIAALAEAGEGSVKLVPIDSYPAIASDADDEARSIEFSAIGGYSGSAAGVADDNASAIGGYSAGLDRIRIGKGWDAADLVAAAPSIARIRIRALLDAAIDPVTIRTEVEAESSETRPENGAGVTESLNELSKLSEFEYAQSRKEAAKRMGVSVRDLDREISKQRHPEGAKQGQGRPLELLELDPWPDTVCGSGLISELVATIRRYLILTESQAIAVALWVVHTHCFDAATHAPRLAITSPEKRCGKSTLLALLSALVAKPLPASNISTAAIFRTIEKLRPTLLIDEADTFLNQNIEMNGILNSGHSRAIAFVIKTVGEDHDPRQFSTWAPIAIAKIGALKGPLSDRSVLIELKRKVSGETVTRLRPEEAMLSDLARKCARWAEDSLDALAGADPEIPDTLHDRAADNWRPLIAIADECHPNIGKLARNAALTLSADAEMDTQSFGLQLLSDLRDIFARDGTDKVRSTEIIGELHRLEDRPWADFHHGKGISARQVSKLLSPYGIKSGTKRFGIDDTAKGYDVSDFADVFRRYLD